MFFHAFSFLNVTQLLSSYFGSVEFPVLRPAVPADVPATPADTATADRIDEGADSVLRLSLLSNGWCVIGHYFHRLRDSLELSAVPLEFTDFQLLLLKAFVGLLLSIGLLIGLYWHRYGNIITNRFIRPSTAKEIEELKLSVARLKLPKEHTPRI